MRRFLLRLFILFPALFIFCGESAKAQNNTDLSQPFKFCGSSEIADSVIFQPFADDNGLIFLPQNQGNLNVYDENSRLLSKLGEFGGEFVAKPLVEEKIIYLLNRFADKNSYRYVLRSIGKFSGITLRQTLFADEYFEKAYLLDAGKFLYVISEKGSLTIVSETDGQIFKKINLEGYINSQPILAENKIFIAAENKIFIFSSLEGVLIDTLNVKNPQAGGFGFTDGILFFGDETGSLYALRIADRKYLWKTKIGAAPVEFILYSENIIVSSNDAFVYSFAKKSGNRLWKTRFQGRILQNPLFSDNYLSVQTLDGDEAAILNISDGKIINRIIFSDNSYNLYSAVKTNNSLAILTDKGLQIFSRICAK